METQFTLNRNPSDEDVIHVEHPWEVCNTDDAEDLSLVSREVATELMRTEQAVQCHHCKPFGEEAVE